MGNGVKHFVKDVFLQTGQMEGHVSGTEADLDCDIRENEDG